MASENAHWHEHAHAASCDQNATVWQQRAATGGGVVADLGAGEKLYSFIIPTRERADTLRFAIGTVLKQTRPNYELIVMDNCSSPETREVVASFHSSKLRYVRSSERLSMADNWERGLEHASGDYVTVLGDDDGVMPDAIEIAEQVNQHWPDHILSWLPFLWMWPDNIVKEYQNFAQLHFGAHVAVHNSRDFLRDIFRSRYDFISLPTMYCSFIPRHMIEEIRAKRGRYFSGSLPDIYSGILHLCSSEQFLYSYRPLTAWGLSRHSTGTSHWFGTGEPVSEFDAENRKRWKEPLDPKLSGAEIISEVLVADLYLKAKKQLFPDDRDLELDMAPFLRRLCRVSAKRFHSRWEDVRTAIADMALKNGLDPSDFQPAPPSDPAPWQFDYKVDVEHNVVNFVCLTDPARVRTIEDFIDLVIRMCVPATKMRIIDRPEEAAAKDRDTLIDELRGACDERLELINKLSRVCEERLELINQLSQTCA